MGRGRPKLTLRNKLNRKLERLQKEIDEIKTKLAGKFEDDIAEQEKKEE